MVMMKSVVLESRHAWIDVVIVVGVIPAQPVVVVVAQQCVPNHWQSEIVAYCSRFGIFKEIKGGLVCVYVLSKAVVVATKRRFATKV